MRLILFDPGGFVRPSRDRIHAGASEYACLAAAAKDGGEIEAKSVRTKGEWTLE
jgi:hypothetical protein